MAMTRSALKRTSPGFGSPMSVKTFPLLLVTLIVLRKRFGDSESFQDELEIALRRRDAVVGFLLECVEDINHLAGRCSPRRRPPTDCNRAETGSGRSVGSGSRRYCAIVAHMPCGDDMLSPRKHLWFALVPLVAMLEAFGVLSGAAAAETIDAAAAERMLGTDRLIGIWHCTGTGDRQPVEAAIRWFHLEDGSLSMTLHPSPNVRMHPTILEGWRWEDYSGTMGYGIWRTVPDKTSSDQASFTTEDRVFKSGTLFWVRHAAGSTESRSFSLRGADRLRFVEKYGSPPHYVYKLDCKRTVKREPVPQ